MARQILRFDPGRLILLDQAETPLHQLGLEVAGLHQFNHYDIVIGDICSPERMRKLFDAFHPQVVFHAAAYKHVPMMENNPSEAVKTNAYGTKILADLAQEHKVECFVMISTDKAVNPTSVMGASKRIAEMYVQSLNHMPDNTSRFVTTRFGNVLGSNGSVIPLFKKQIENGGPVTVTHPDITRYFMTIPEACQLVLEAGAMGKGGEIFVFDMGRSIRIADLAHRMIRLSGLEPDTDIPIVYTGLRPGEKLYEELLAKAETTIPTHHPKILVATVQPPEHREIAECISTLMRLFKAQDNTAIIEILKEHIPEYTALKL